MFQTPILFLIFNRPDTTQKVFESICSVQPKRLYIAADGARKDKEGEQLLCEQTRSIINKIDWPCEVKTLFREQNLGCKLAVSSGINWFFENEEEGIILEDDCLPHPDFYAFCEENLNKYRNDNQVMHIGGTNFQIGNKRGDGSYYFSRYNHIWGWASWRRAWKQYDVNMQNYKPESTLKMLQKFFSSDKEIGHWQKIFDIAHSGKINTWDYQWTYAIWQQSGLSIIPNVNLVSNLGFGSGTHTYKNDVMGLSNMQVNSILPIIHPEHKVVMKDADKYAFDKYFHPSLLRYFWMRFLKIFA